MKTILLLNDEIRAATLQLGNAAPDPIATQPGEENAGCNCDRWGHPCPGCVTRTLELQSKSLRSRNQPGNEVI
jgi:hypothetical protein